MFEIGFWEITLIGVIALLVIGPERLPGAARTVGLYVGRIRRYVSHVQADIQRELHADELRKLVDNPDVGGIKDVVRETKEALGTVKEDLQSAERIAAGSADWSSTLEDSGAQPDRTESPIAEAQASSNWEWDDDSLEDDDLDTERKREAEPTKAVIEPPRADVAEAPASEAQAGTEPDSSGEGAQRSTSSGA